MTMPAETEDRTIAYATPAAVRPRTPFLVRSWLIWCAAAVFCGSAAQFILADRDRFAKFFKSVRVIVPPLQQWILDVPGWAIGGLGIATVITLLMVQVAWPSKQTAAVIHLSASTIWCLTILVFREIMWQVVFYLLQGAIGLPANKLLWP